MKKRNKISQSLRECNHSAILQYRDWLKKEIKKREEYISKISIPEYQMNCSHQWTVFKSDVPGIFGGIRTFECPYCEKCGLIKGALDNKNTA